MSTFNSFAIFGGRIGLPIVEALARRQVSVVFFSRPGCSTRKTVPSGVEMVDLDFLDVGRISAALQRRRVEVVLLTVGISAAVSQNALVDAAKPAGVKLFAPTECRPKVKRMNLKAEGTLGDKREVAGNCNDG
ncbi:hypothetical protein C8F04DRAFT_117071 [Mycena alexandri]|uniref:NmrA-like domain-containing protein n=1 Tax=Mycena alexandri TaxID=1745969 RepID=A0AAD6TBT7_9AGAR|nr:hypothetical protein C8F04DRAFT_117071 [Mycena alexandri]